MIYTSAKSFEANRFGMYPLPVLALLRHKLPLPDRAALRIADDRDV